MPAVSRLARYAAPGVIDQTYLERVAQVVAWAKAVGIYVVIDMHQDAWSKYLYTAPGEACVAPFQAIRGFDGAPRWASEHVAPACALNGVRELDPAVQEDFQKLYDDAKAPDGVGLQEHYANAMLALARRFHEEPTVAGYEIINEPNISFDLWVDSRSGSAEIKPERYAALITNAYRAIKSVNSEAEVIVGGLLIGSPPEGQDHDQFDYLYQLYASQWVDQYRASGLSSRRSRIRENSAVAKCSPEFSRIRLPHSNVVSGQQARHGL